MKSDGKRQIKKLRRQGTREWKELVKRSLRNRRNKTHLDKTQEAKGPRWGGASSHGLLWREALTRFITNNEAL
jgi:hypothetical protein